MSVLDVDKIDWTGTNTEDFHREYQITYRVTTSTSDDGPAVVLAAGALPRYGDPYVSGNDSDAFATCRFVGNCRREQGDSTRLLWNVDARYSTRGSNRDPNDEPGKPLDWSWKVSGNYGTGQKYVTKDQAGRPLVNSSNEPFEDVPPLDDQLLLLKLEKNFASIEMDQWAETRGKVNSATLWGLDPRRVKLVQWTWQPQWTAAGSAYVACVFEVAINLDGYYYEPLDMGFQKIDGVNGDGTVNYSPILIKGEQPSKPQFLDGNGGVLAAGADPVYFDGIGANPDPFELEEEYDFTTIFPAVLPSFIT